MARFKTSALKMLRRWSQQIISGTLFCARKAFLRMKDKKEGQIVNISSSAVKSLGRIKESAYVASKWGVAGFTEFLKSHDIKVISYCPGGMNTSFWQSPIAIEYQPTTREFSDPKQITKILYSSLTLPNNLNVDDILVKRFG